jgi:ribosomal-protein-alanine N-acetyltransferase
MFSDPLVMRYIGKPPHASVAETLAFLQRNRALYPAREGVRWVITRRGSDRLIGSCGHWRLMKEHLRAEIGYDLLPAFWGQGLMDEALRAILRFGFATMGLHSAEAQIDPAHVRSRRVLERLGFQQDGLLRENFLCMGQFTDTAVFTLLAREFTAAHGGAGQAAGAGAALTRRA